MASTSKRMRYEISDVLDIIDETEDDNEPGGMSGSEESEIDREFGFSDDESSDEDSDKDDGEVGDTGNTDELGDAGDVSDAADVGDTGEVGESGNSSCLDSGNEDEDRGRAIVNCFIIFKQHMANFPDNEELRRSTYYSIVDFREELVRQLCGLDKNDVPPLSNRVQPVQDYDTIHIPEFAEIRKYCYLCSRADLGQLRISTYCSAPQCGKFLHITKEKNCFKEWHSKKYHKS